MSGNYDKRDIGVEFARVLGCMIVIGVHISLNDFENGVYDLSRGYINCCLADGVAVFWLIMGCFLFRTTSYKIVLRRLVKNIIIPIIIFQSICLHFSGWIDNGGNLFQSIVQTKETYMNGIKSIFMLRTFVPRTGHLWYCYAYLLVVLSFPILKAFVNWMEEEPLREKWFCIITFVILLLNDCSVNKMLEFSHHGLNAAIPAMIEVIWGHILYRYREIIINKKQKWLLGGMIVGFFLMNLLRLLIVSYSGSKTILYWYSTVGLLCGILILSVCILWGEMVRTNTIIKKVVYGVASHTFIIYLVHICIRTIIYRSNIHKSIYEVLNLKLDGFTLEILYTLIIIGIVFLISLLVSVIIRLIGGSVTRYKRSF